MSGQPIPPVLAEAFAINAPDCSAGSPVAGGKTAPFPEPSQTGVTNGAASLNDGFPPLTMTNPSSGGIPPFGVDMNGILYLLSAHIAALNAGQPYLWSSALSTAMGGYAVGAVVQQAADPNAFWVNTVAANTDDPDSGTPGESGWWSTKPLRTTFSFAGGTTQNDIALPGPSDYIVDFTVTGSGALNVTGFVAQRDGQRLTIRKADSSGNAVTLESLTGSAAGNQLQIVAAGISLALQYMVETFMWNSTENGWVQV